MKIIDRREIEFAASTILKVITVSTKAAQGFGLPGLPPVGVQFCPREGKVDILYGTRQAPRAVSLSAEAMGALLVAYCIRVRIPMPRNADKGIRIESNSVVLAFRTKFSESPTPQVAEGTARPAESVTAWTWLQPERVPSER